MTIELFFIILLCLFVFILLGVALHLARTMMRQYITELERDYSNAVGVLQGSALLSLAQPTPGL